MEIKAVKFRRDGFYTQPFVFGGEEGKEKFDKNVRYRGSLQNYLIDTGSEVILVDTVLPAARETQNRVREFIRNHPTVYMGTHTPQGYENLEAKRVMDLDNPVPTIWPEVVFEKKEASGKYVCSVCGYVYDPAEHDGVAFEDLPDDWRCPRCKQPKEKFNKA